MIMMQRNALGSTPYAVVSWVRISFDEKSELFEPHHHYAGIAVSGVRCIVQYNDVEHHFIVRAKS